MLDTDCVLLRATIEPSECYKPRVLKSALQAARILLKDGTLGEGNTAVVTLLLEYVNLKLEQSANLDAPGFIVNGKLLCEDFGAFLSEQILLRHDVGRDHEETLEAFKSIWLNDMRLYMQRCCPGVQWSARNKRDSSGKNQRGFVGVRWKPGYEPQD